jgi:hypothetical protein
MGPRAGLEAVEKNLFPLSGFDLRFLERSARSLISIPTAQAVVCRSWQLVHLGMNVVLRIISPLAEVPVVRPRLYRNKWMKCGNRYRSLINFINLEFISRRCQRLDYRAEPIPWHLKKNDELVRRWKEAIMV